jgi:hypothetical protein
LIWEGVFVGEVVGEGFVYKRVQVLSWMTTNKLYTETVYKQDIHTSRRRILHYSKSLISNPSLEITMVPQIITLTAAAMAVFGVVYADCIQMNQLSDSKKPATNSAE